MHNALINKYDVDIVKELMNAIAFAADKHKFQKRKGAMGIPYINHPLEVMSLIVHHHPACSVVLLQAAVLHDTVEDTGTTARELTEKFGDKVCKLVLEVTDDMSLSSVIRKQRQIDNAPDLSDEAKCIKIADKTCNIRDILYTRIRWPRQRKIAYVNWAMEVIRQIRGAFPSLEAEFDVAVQEAAKELNHDF